MFSYCYNCVDKVKPDRMSWHWIEAYAFILFMFLAPSTAKDLIFTDEQAAEIERLEQRIEQLENSQEIDLKKTGIRVFLILNGFYTAFGKTFSL
tara:strand:- start:198 stop:479 length:282 start_codon:yes stop_codon:yes gene_type:complete